MAKTIQLDSVHKEYRTVGTTHVAVDDLTLDISAGSFTTLVGPSGCGKTTTLRMLAGLETPTAGRIHFDETDVTDLPPQQRNAAMVFQSIALYPHMTVRENIGYGPKVRGVPKDERNERIQEAAATLQITEQLDKMPSELSGGQQQRVALGGAFVQNPEILLLDEPMSDLDAKLKADLRVEIQRLYQELDTTVVYVTHDQTEAMTMSDQVVLLSEGELAQVDPPQTLFDRPNSEYVARFIGTPSTNVFSCEVERDDGTTIVGPGFRVPVPDNALTELDSTRLGIRPQYLHREEGEHRFTVTVDVVEPLGTESVIHSTTADGTRVDVLSSNAATLDPGTEIIVGFDRDELFIFDTEGKTVLFGTDLSTREYSVP
jgi:multiple sugar transport system ATP-binding protein